MSNLSGKCDLYDHIFGMGGYYDRNGNPVQFNLIGASVYFSDIMKDFEAFKKASGGVLHRNVNVNVSTFNQDMIASKCNHFKIIEHENEKGKTTYTYEYFDKEYTVKELNKKGGVYVDDPIYFSSILELLPYLPCIVTAAYASDNTHVVWISNESYAESEHIDMLKSGFDTGMVHYYRKALADLYFKVCQNYLCYKLDERICTEPISKHVLGITDEGYIMRVQYDIDANHDIEYMVEGQGKITYWTSPKAIGDNKILLHGEDVDVYLKEAIDNGTAKIKYVRMPEGGFPVHIG